TAFIDYSAVDSFSDVGLGDTVASNGWTRLIGTLARLMHLPRRGETGDNEEEERRPKAWAGSDAWIRLTWSTNGGATGTPFFMPGAPWDASPAGLTAPYSQVATASSDPVVVAAPNGDFHVIFMAFNRGDVNWIVDGRFRDLNIPDEPARHGLTFQGFTTLASGNNASFGTLHDKPHAIAVLDPSSPVGYQLYVSYTLFNGNSGTGKFQSQLFVARSGDGGLTFTTDKINQSTNQNSGTWLVSTGSGQVFAFWRGFGSSPSIFYVKRVSDGNWTKAASILGNPAFGAFDQGNIKVDATSIAALKASEQNITPRSNGFPAAAISGNGTMFVVFQECANATTGAPLACGSGGSPRVMVTSSKDGGATWSARKAFDIAPRTAEPDGQGYFWNVGRDNNNAHPQLMPSIACAAGSCMVTYWESRTSALTANNWIGGYHRIMDLRGALLNADGTVAGRSFQISRYPYRTGTRLVQAAGTTVQPRAETVNDIARVNEVVNPDGTLSCAGPPGIEPPLPGLEPGCIPRLNFYCRPQSGAGTTCFMGDYNALTPATSFVRGNDGTWKVPASPQDVPYVGFLTASSDNRNLVPPAAPLPSKGGVAPTDQLSRFTAWTPGTGGLPACEVGGSRNTDLLLAKVSLGLLITAPTTAKTTPSPGDGPFLTFPLQVWNNSNSPKTVTFTIDPPGTTTSTGSFSKTTAFAKGGPGIGVVTLNPFSSTTRVVYATTTAPIFVQVTDGTATNGITFNAVGAQPSAGSSGASLIVSDPLNISAENISAENISAENISAENISAENISAENISAENISAENISAENMGIQETTWVIQASGDPTRAYTALANVDKAYSSDYDFHVVIYRLSSVGACVDATGKTTLQYHATVIANTGAANISAENISAENISAENISAENGFPSDSTNIINNSVFTPKPGKPKTSTANAAAAPSGGFRVGEGVDAQPPETEFTVVKLLAIPKKPLSQIASRYNAANNPASLTVSDYWCDANCAPVLKGADLVVGGALSASPVSLNAGLSFQTSSYTVPNTGTLNAGPRRYGFYLSGNSTLALDPLTGLVDLTQAAFLGSVDFTDPLKPFTDPTTPGTSDQVPASTLTIPPATAPGIWYVYLYADDRRKVSELNEANNITPALVVTVTPDTTPPVFAPHADVMAEATGSTGATVTYVSPVATDAVDGVVAVTCAPASGSLFALGSTTITCSASDKSGNAATSAFAVVVKDTTGPTIGAHADVTAEASGPSGATVTYTNPTASDLVDGADAVSCTPTSGSTFALGNTTVSCTAQDAHGNATTAASFVVHVVDTTPPVLTLPAPIVGASSMAGASVNYSVSAVDLVDGPRPVTCAPPSGATFPVGTTTVTCSSSDSRGNTATGSFVVTVRLQYGFVGVQNLPPPAGKTFNPGSAVPFKWQFTLGGVAIDSSTANPKITITGPSGSANFTPGDPGKSSFQPPTLANGWTWQFNWQSVDNTTGAPIKTGTYTVTVTNQLSGQVFSGGQITLK
ncbi:MAG TPA: HYR domain-containing protein, partial [Vicinamibacterales bacterium]|nr:HYR domain-containing protein [Vicinamibacterales bacterium]